MIVVLGVNILMWITGTKFVCVCLCVCVNVYVQGQRSTCESGSVPRLLDKKGHEKVYQFYTFHVPCIHQMYTILKDQKCIVITQ